MVDRICVVLEALSIAVCLHRLYGKKFRFDIATVSLMTIEMIMMQAIDYFGWPKELSMLFYPIIAGYCVIEFGVDLKKLVINNILNAIIICVFQVGVSILFYIMDGKNTMVGIRLMISNLLVLLLITIAFPKLKINRITSLLKDKEIISIIAIITCIIITFFCLIGFKRINFLENTDWLKNILFSISVAMICLLVLNVGKYKLKSKEIETELKVHKLYADSFDNLVDSIRSKQHEFDNHINTIYSQHYIYNTYMELVEAQKNYCQFVTVENRFNKLLNTGNPIIIGFLYGKFNEIDKLGIDISYCVNIEELQLGIPIYKLVEVLGNLLSNVTEALMKNPLYNKLYVFIEEKDGDLIIEVRNESDYISYAEIGLFFNKGYSKKGEDRGIGLFHTKTICDEYNLSLLCQNIEIDEKNWILFRISNKKETE